ncbi:MAG: hypothetical protein ACKVN9_10765 [Methylophilaceae bacterium]
MTDAERLRNKLEGMYAAIEERYACIHPHRELRLRLIKGGRLAYYRQCIRCGYAGQAVSSRIALGETIGVVIPNFDNDAELSWRKAKSEDYSHASYEVNQERRLIYEDYLLSNQWKAIKALVFKRANDMCEICELNDAVDVHHETYENVFAEKLEDLKAVCRFCHDYLHGKIKL